MTAGWTSPCGYTGYMAPCAWGHTATVQGAARVRTALEHATALTRREGGTVEDPHRGPAGSWVLDVAAAPDVVDMVRAVIGDDVGIIRTRVVGRAEHSDAVLPWCQAVQRDMQLDPGRAVVGWFVVRPPLLGGDLIEVRQAGHADGWAAHAWLPCPPFGEWPAIVGDLPGREPVTPVPRRRGVGMIADLRTVLRVGARVAEGDAWAVLQVLYTAPDGIVSAAPGTSAPLRIAEARTGSAWGPR